MMTEQEKIDYLKAVDFGDIDANADPNLDRYFIDNNYWAEIFEKPIYCVIGKKGTGKSAIYQFIKKKSIEKGINISNRDFGDFPFERLLTLSDDSFSKPNQYQSIWLHLILDIFIDMIVNSPNKDKKLPSYKELKQYYDVCIGDTVNLHKDSITKVKKSNFTLAVAKIGISPSISSDNEFAKQIGSGETNVSTINAKLLSLLEDYFCNRKDNSKYLIQFDRLDDNYNQYTDVESYYQVIISLMKVVYTINNMFRRNRIDGVKTIVYLRTDIINELGKRDAKSARWEEYYYNISWAIQNLNDWNSSPLLKMIDKRMESSTGDSHGFNDIFDTDTINLRNYNRQTGRVGAKQEVFKYMVDKTFHRPRDIIQFCKCIQQEIKETTNCQSISFRNIKNAEKKYTFWLVNSELTNEINPVLKNVDEVYELLKSIGRRPFSFRYFCTKYTNNITAMNSMKPLDLLKYLYDIGIILNVQRDHIGALQFRSIIRNNGKVNKNMQLMIHPGVWIGLLS